MPSKAPGQRNQTWGRESNQGDGLYAVASSKYSNGVKPQ